LDVVVPRREPSNPCERHIRIERIIPMPLAQEILTDRLHLRPPTLADAANIFGRYSYDARVCRYLSWTPHQSVDDTIAYLKRGANDDPESMANYLIFLRKTGQLLGSVGGSVQGTRLQFGYCLAHDCWGNGFATEATRAYVEVVMNDLPIWRVQAFCDVENRVSARVLEKSGLSYEGTLRRYMVLPNLGEAPRDVHCYAKVRA
jgi:RimJ/RimL family protein N-acetyltransferase